MRGEDFAETLRRFVRRHPDAGYGGMFIDWAMSPGAPAYGSWGNGAPMRTVAAGWIAKDVDDVDKLAARQAIVSHNHPHAVRAAQAVSRAIFDLRHGKSVENVRHETERTFGYDLRPGVTFISGGFDVSAAGTVPPALASAFDSRDWEEAVRTVVLLGGDTDTLACIAGAVAEAIHGVPVSVAEQARAHLSQDLLEVLVRFDKPSRDDLPLVCCRTDDHRERIDLPNDGAAYGQAVFTTNESFASPLS